MPPVVTTFLMEDHFVSNPPEKRINAMAIVPMTFARPGSPKGTSAKPLGPASIPIARKTTRTGMLILEESFVEHAHIRTRTAKVMSTVLMEEISLKKFI